jgi:hypothetical protein
VNIYLLKPQNYIGKNPQKNKFNELGDCLNELRDFFNEWFFGEKSIKNVCGIEKCCIFAPCDYPASR